MPPLSAALHIQAERYSSQYLNIAGDRCSSMGHCQAERGPAVRPEPGEQGCQDYRRILIHRETYRSPGAVWPHTFHQLPLAWSHEDWACRSVDEQKKENSSCISSSCLCITCRLQRTWRNWWNLNFSFCCFSSILLPSVLVCGASKYAYSWNAHSSEPLNS